MHTSLPHCFVVIAQPDGQIAALHHAPLPPAVSPAALDTLCEQILALVENQFPPHAAEVQKASTRSPPDEAFLNEVEHAIDERLSDRHFSVERLAAHVLMSPRHLRRRMVNLTGETPAALLRRRRVERAEMLLRSGAPSVKEVAHAVGYSGAKSLYRAFVALRGCSPSDVRET